jgi:DNA polymerase-3 subunit beta
MRIRFQKSDLAPAVALAQGISNEQSTIPILSNILLTTDFDNRVILLATDYETRVQIDIPAIVEQRGTTTIPAKIFHETLSNLPDDCEIVLDADRQATLTCREIKLTLATMPAADFPKLTAVAPEFELEVAESDLRRLFDQVSVAIPAKDPRKMLLGALLEVGSGYLRGIATDGKLLANARIPMAADLITEPTIKNIIVPHKVVERLIYSLVSSGNVRIGWDAKMVSFSYRNIVLSTQQIDGKYPDWRRVVPNSFRRELRFRRADLLAAIRRASIVCDMSAQSVTLDFQNATILIEAENYDRGQFREQIPATVDESFRISFNYKFLILALKAIEQDNVVMQANQPETQVIFSGEDEENLSYLVMPIKITPQSRPPEPASSPDDYDDEQEGDENE